MSSPSIPGYYLEAKIYKNGPLNESAFIEKLNNCINQSTSEYLIESLIESCNRNEKFGISGYKQLARFARRSIELSLQFPVKKIEHFAPPFALFQYFAKTLEIFQETNRLKLPLVMCLEEGKDIHHITSDIEQMRQFWELEYSNEKCVGKHFKFSALGGPKSLSNLLGEDFNSFDADELKFYAEEIGEGLGNVPRSFFIYVEITNEFLEVYTYNWNKVTLQKLHTSIETHVHWNRQRYKLVNNALTQKLGLFHHPCPIDVSSVLKKSTPVQVLSQACMIMELKEESQSFSLGSLINSDEITHVALPSDDSVQSFKMNGMFPLIKDGAVFKDKDKVKTHGVFLNLMYDKKKEIFEDCYKLAYAFKR